MFRTQLCKLIENHPQFEHSKEAYENPHSLRFGNLVMKNVLVVVIIILSIGVYWKQRHQKNPMRVSGNFNVITLKQTVFFLILISFDNTCLSYVICWDNFFGMSEDPVIRPCKDLENQTKCVHQLSNQSLTSKSSTSKVIYIRNFSVEIEIDSPDVQV